MPSGFDSSCRLKSFLGLLLCVSLVSCSPSRPASPPAQSAASPALFEEVAERAGVQFRYTDGRQGMATILEQSGSGCAMFDYDGDGKLDLYLLNGRDLYGRNLPLTHNALYHNNGDGTFTDVTAKAGVPGTGFSIGVAVGDFNNDGHPDLYVCQWGKNCLYQNNGNGTFTDVTAKAGVAATEFGGNFHTGAAFFDYDRDGKLDLFACSYVRFDHGPNGLHYCKLGDGTQSNCPPAVYDGTPSLLYRNNGDGTFTNVTKKAGVYIPNGKALSAVTCDVDNDGWTDLIVGNDGEEAWLLRNNRNGTFTNAASAAGIAFARDGATMAAMGIDLGDFMNEGRPGFLVADFSKRPDHLWRQLEGGFFDEVSSPSLLGDAGFPYLGFGAGFFDYDNDGWLDIFIGNGHVYPEVDTSSLGEKYLQPNQLFHSQRDGTFREVTKEAGPAFQILNAARGAAFGDYDNDGKLDILINSQGGPPLLLHNTYPSPGHYLMLRLQGVKSNRDAIGARVWITVGKMRLLRDVKNGGSYLSASDFRLHFGLGEAKQVDKVEVRWPNGTRQTFGPLPADRLYTILEGGTPQ